MSEFFEAPPPQPEALVEEAEGPAWFTSPRGVLPCSIPLNEIIARNDKVVIAVSGAVAYGSGFELSVVVFLGRDPSLRLSDPFNNRPEDSHGGGDLAPEMLRFGLEYGDGRKSANTNARPQYDDGEADPGHPTLVARGGRGGGRQWQQDFWCWPLPPEGPLQLVCEWPSMEIPLTRREIEARLILDGAARAQEIFPES
jgi:hypothetical protein